MASLVSANADRRFPHNGLFVAVDLFYFLRLAVVVVFAPVCRDHPRIAILCAVVVVDVANGSLALPGSRLREEIKLSDVLRSIPILHPLSTV